jgi:hypothetical protein
MSFSPVSKWKLRDPAIFPVTYTDCTLAAHESSKPVFLSSHSSKLSARHAADRFREWRYCLRGKGHGHRAYRLECDSTIGLETREFGGRWELWVTVKVKAHKSLLDLNPGLEGLLSVG